MLSLKSLEENLDERSFIRIHKSYIVAINKINGIEGNEIFIQRDRIPISRNYRQQVLEKVVSKRLWDGYLKNWERRNHQSAHTLFSTLILTERMIKFNTLKIIAV